jgi:hypothetical protein
MRESWRPNPQRNDPETDPRLRKAVERQTGETVAGGMGRLALYEACADESIQTPLSSPPRGEELP